VTNVRLATWLFRVIVFHLYLSIWALSENS
jgi:hypothetical protein